MADSNKIEFGLSHSYFAPLTAATAADGKVTYTYSAPIRLQGIQSMTQEAQGDSTNIYAEDMVWYNYTANNGYSGELVFVHFSDELRKTIFKHEEATNGMLIERSDVQSAEGALIYQCQGDKNKTRHVLYDVTFGNPKVEPKTKEDGIEATTVTIPYTAVPIELPTGEQITKGKCSEGDTAYDSLFTALTVPTLGTSASETE